MGWNGDQMPSELPRERSLNGTWERIAKSRDMYNQVYRIWKMHTFMGSMLYSFLQ